jgi:TIR domain
MKAFISYASEQRDLAERLAIGFRNMGFRVFFDQDDLPAGDSFDARIRKALGNSHLFVFLISEESLREGAYTLTELKMAKKRWPSSAGKVLPVLINDIPMDSIPPYLRSVSILKPTGDVVAEVLDAADQLTKQCRQKLLRHMFLSVFALTVAVLSVFAFFRSPSVPLGGTDANTLTDDDMNSHIFTLKNGSHVRMVGSIVKNESNVDEAIIRDAVESMAFHYNWLCYDRSFGQLNTDMPEGTVVVDFDILDQLPQHVALNRSEFTDKGFNDCVVAELSSKNIGAGPNGKGHVSYAFKFLPN